MAVSFTVVQANSILAKRVLIGWNGPDSWYTMRVLIWDFEAIANRRVRGVKWLSVTLLETLTVFEGVRVLWDI
jgi:hypothetical protein